MDKLEAVTASDVYGGESAAPFMSVFVLSLGGLGRLSGNIRIIIVVVFEDDLLLSNLQYHKGAMWRCTDLPRARHSQSPQYRYKIARNIQNRCEIALYA